LEKCSFKGTASRDFLLLVFMNQCPAGQVGTGINNSGGKLATGVNDMGGKQWKQLSNC
jgi:hypothetical protein